MKNIVSWGHLVITNNTEGNNQFGNKLAETITDMQNKNLEVEIQYQMTNEYCSALILGREK